MTNKINCLSLKKTNTYNSNLPYPQKGERWRVVFIGRFFRKIQLRVQGSHWRDFRSSDEYNFLFVFICLFLSRFFFFFNHQVGMFLVICCFFLFYPKFMILPNMLLLIPLVSTVSEGQPNWLNESSLVWNGYEVLGSISGGRCLKRENPLYLPILGLRVCVCTSGIWV